MLTSSAILGTCTYVYARIKLPGRIRKNNFRYEHYYHTNRNQDITLYKDCSLNGYTRFISKMDMETKSADFLINKSSKIPIPNSSIIKYYKFEGDGYVFKSLFGFNIVSKSKDELKTYIIGVYNICLIFFYLMLISIILDMNNTKYELILPGEI